MKDNFMNLVEKRRTIYNLGKLKHISEDEIVELVQNAVKHCPTAFNSQSGRIVVLFGENYQKLWDITMESLRKIVPENAFAATESRINSFKAGSGTVLFFEDEDVVSSLQEKFPLYKDNFPKWSLEANGMLQYIVWTALAEKNIGASLQHYNPVIDAEVTKVWNLPKSWNLIAQMPFGNIEKPADIKTFEPIEKRVKVFK